MFEVEINDHLGKVLGSIQDSFQSQKGTNCVLRCEGKEIKCHKYILTAFSSFFDPLQDNESMLITNIKFRHLQMLIDAIYYGKLRASVEEFPKLVKKAQKLGFQNLFAKQTGSSQADLLRENGSQPRDEDDEEKRKKMDEMNLQDTLRAIKSLNEFSSQHAGQVRQESDSGSGSESYEETPLTYVPTQPLDARKSSVSPSATLKSESSNLKSNYEMPQEADSSATIATLSNHSSKSQIQVTIHHPSTSGELDTESLLESRSSGQGQMEGEQPEEITVSIAPNDLVNMKEPHESQDNKLNPQSIHCRRSSNPSSYRYLKTGVPPYVESSPQSSKLMHISSHMGTKSALSPPIVPNSSLSPSLTITSMPLNQNSSPSVTLTSSATSLKQKLQTNRVGSTFSVTPRLSTATSITIVSDHSSTSQILNQGIKKSNGKKSVESEEESNASADTARVLQRSSSPATYVQGSGGIVLISSEPGPSHGKKNPQRVTRAAYLGEVPNPCVDLTEELEEEEDEEEEYEEEGQTDDDDDNWDDFRIEGEDDDWRNGSGVKGYGGGARTSGGWSGESPSPKRRRTRDPGKFKNRYPCPECGKILANYYYKEEHVRVKHQKINLSCVEPGCNFEVLERDKFNEHLKKCHGKEIKRGRPKSDA